MPAFSCRKMYIYRCCKHTRLHISGWIPRLCWTGYSCSFPLIVAKNCTEKREDNSIYQILMRNRGSSSSCSSGSMWILHRAWLLDWLFTDISSVTMMIMYKLPIEFYTYIYRIFFFGGKYWFLTIMVFLTVNHCWRWVQKIWVLCNLISWSEEKLEEYQFIHWHHLYGARRIPVAI